MTAAILQFNQHTQSNNQSDYIDTPMTKEYHQIMIDLLNTEHPFRAVRLAEIFNYENGFELIDKGIIRKWRKEISFLGKQNLIFCKSKSHFSGIKIEKIQELKYGFSGIENENIEDSENKNAEIKIQLEEGYRQLLGIENKL